MSTALGIPYPAGTAGLAVEAAEVATGILNRIARSGGWALSRLGGAVTLILTPSPLADGTPFGAIREVLTEDQTRWVMDVAGATGADRMFVGEALVNNLAVWEHANPGVAPPASVYDDVAEMAVASAAPNAGPTPGNVRITRTLTASLGACAALACPPPVDGYGGGAHGCTKLPPGDGLDSHHMPAASATAMPRDMGPAIRMERADHWQTASYGGGANGARYAAQRAAVAAGNPMQAIFMDIRDVRRIAAAQGDPGRYEASIAQMLAYARCLQAHGLLR